MVDSGSGQQAADSPGPLTSEARAIFNNFGAQSSNAVNSPAAPLVSPRPVWVCLVKAECGMEDPYFALRNVPVRGVPEAAVNVTVEYW